MAKFGQERNNYGACWAGLGIRNAGKNGPAWRQSRGSDYLSMLCTRLPLFLRRDASHVQQASAECLCDFVIKPPRFLSSRIVRPLVPDNRSRTISNRFFLFIPSLHPPRLFPPLFCLFPPVRIDLSGISEGWRWRMMDQRLVTRRCQVCTISWLTLSLIHI